MALLDMVDLGNFRGLQTRPSPGDADSLLRPDTNARPDGNPGTDADSSADADGGTCTQSDSDGEPNGRTDGDTGRFADPRINRNSAAKREACPHPAPGLPVVSIRPLRRRDRLYR